MKLAVFYVESQVRISKIAPKPEFKIAGERGGIVRRTAWTVYRQRQSIDDAVITHIEDDAEEVDRCALTAASTGIVRFTLFVYSCFLCFL